MVTSGTANKDTLQTTHRPRTWDAIIGQDHIVTLLKGIIKNHSYHYTRSYILDGQAGGGKTTISKVFANALACTHEDDSVKPCLTCESCKQFLNGNYSDYIEVDAGQYNKVEDIKTLIEVAKTYPIHANKYRVILLDEAHRVSNAGWDAMLKLLEDGNTKTIFLFATTEGDKIRRAIHSRSISLKVRPLTAKEIYNELQRVAQVENIDYDPESLNAIAYANIGRMRDALKTLDMYHRAHGHVKNLIIESEQERFTNTLRFAFFKDIKSAHQELDSLALSSQSDLGDLLADALTAIWLYPQEVTSPIPQTKLQELKSLFGNELKQIISLYFEYKPQTLEQMKLFFAILAHHSGAKVNTQSVTNTNQVRSLFHKKETNSTQISQESANIQKSNTDLEQIVAEDFY